MSNDGMPFGDEKMPFYALGVNLAKQVGGQTGFNSLLNEDELDLVLKGFDETLRGTSVQEGEKVLMKYGQELNKILQERSNGLVTRVKEEGEEFVKGFLDCTEDAVQTESGLVYYSMKEGEGASPEVTNTVEVHYVSF
jgi:FKBP-type peptidyl-prolyl cis-trans isomerase